MPSPAGPADSREIGELAVWSVTSAKPGNGVELLRDGRTDTFWQSEGAQPHVIDVQFQKKVLLLEVHVYLDYKLDESYTPKRLSVRVGSTASDLQEVRQVDVTEPSGWLVLSLRNPDGQPLKAFHLQVVVLANHQNGRDTHIRQLQVFGPRIDPLRCLGHPLGLDTPELTRYAVLR